MTLERPEQTIALLGILVLVVASVYAFCRWLLSGPRTPDPWGAEVEQAVEQDQAVPVCPHCLTPQDHNGWFCPECGSTFGPYSNYLPTVYIFSIGEAVRGGIDQPNRWNFLVTAGYVLIAFGYFSVLAPIYCLFLFINRWRIRARQRSEPTPASA